MPGSPTRRYQPVGNGSPFSSRIDLSPGTPNSSNGTRGGFLDASPHDSGRSRIGSSVSSKFSLTADPALWDIVVSPNEKEPDDDLHNPNSQRDRSYDNRFVVSRRGVENMGCLSILITALLGLFVGYPLVSHFLKSTQSTNGGYNLGGINGTGQVADIGNFALIDADTPEDAYTLTSYTDGTTEYELVFSDEFNVEGRTFWPGDDPYWEALDLHYWQTDDLEWHSPKAITTKNGSLQITLSKETPSTNHNLSYQGGMLTTWNKFCFTGGIFVASVQIAGSNDVVGLWPAVWTMGNLGRAGYGASLEGLWPYSYDTCDVGTVANQSVNGIPAASVDGTGDIYNNGALSYLPGQRLSRCTCSGESHPGPVHSDGTYVGRSAPEIDVFEATVSGTTGQVSQSGQWAPFNYEYIWDNTTENYIVYNSTGTSYNTYMGGAYQQSTSSLTDTAQGCYQLNGTDCFSTYGIEYVPGFSDDDAYITWINDDSAAWTLKAAGMKADSKTNISARAVSQEPMYLITNLAISESFGTIDWDDLVFPAIMSIDWMRVYQKKGSTNIGCDPTDFPTAAYIAEYSDAYSNPNYTTWEQYGQTFPTNSYLGEC